MSKPPKKKPRRLADILAERAKWSKKDWRKDRKRRRILNKKWTKKLCRSVHNEDPLKIIPKGTHYCYEVLEINEDVVVRCKLCPYYYVIHIPEEDLDQHPGIVAEGQTHIGGCKLLKETDDDMGGWGLLWDRVKECGLNIYPKKNN